MLSSVFGFCLGGASCQRENEERTVVDHRLKQTSREYQRIARYVHAKIDVHRFTSTGRKMTPRLGNTCQDVCKGRFCLSSTAPYVAKFSLRRVAQRTPESTQPTSYPIRPSKMTVRGDHRSSCCLRFYCCTQAAQKISRSRNQNHGWFLFVRRVSVPNPAARQP